ncbi:hypothetical protein E2C01_071842 [Portunus trituberculatus]|uniref:Uncharacterized protein n=1 Tax=Portunus trituberculatus TaxID=210409 RepID=A0A5B7HY34_PORTR|nr:hypothetical protein [Portunus trituberculatus]
MHGNGLARRRHAGGTKGEGRGRRLSVALVTRCRQSIVLPAFFKVIVASVLRSAGGAQPPLPHESVPEAHRGKCCVACDLEAGRCCVCCDRTMF